MQLAIDGNPTTEWGSEIYQGGFEANNKGGVGLYVDAGSPIAARQLDLTTSKPGFEAAIYASNSVPGGIDGWDKVSRTLRVKQDQKFELDTARQRFRNYLVWITQLPEDGQATIKELSLKK